ncbi:class I adenylate-forming enzyme family protein [Sneathiella glossodoripedis]|uniref:class I adenylate-forming enzyme family protein n=1 Tax=Sneathiella glossodoripedis TaxID=418853 RepID=UPI00047052F2|nr:class I adenylate-forming enzyme family protein [Sneathiella glossodoripedis]
MTTVSPLNPIDFNAIDEEVGFVPFPLLFQRAAFRDPELPVLKVEDTVLTWAELVDRINRVANLMKARGLGRGDKIAILARSSTDYIAVFLGALQAGVCAVPLSGMASSEQLAGMMRDSAAKMLFVSSSTLDLVSPFAGTIPELPEDGYVAFDFKKDGWQSFEELIGAATNELFIANIAPEDAFNLIYSSGTTGVPKGIEQSHYMRYQHVIRFKAMGLEAGATTMIATALYSNTTLVAMLPTLALGGRVVLMPKFDVQKYLELAESEKATHTMLVPVQYQRLLAYHKFDDFDLSSFRLKLSTSAPLREQVKQDALKRWPGNLIEIYGLTEGGIGTVLSTEEFPDKLASVGKAGLGAEIRIIDDNGNELPVGKIGEIVGRSDAMMTGYHNRPDLTEEMIWTSPEGQKFFKSGDMGRLDEDGFLYLLDRKKDMILSGGFNIYAADIEAELVKHPDVDDVAVIAIPSEEWGETPLGLVVLKTGAKTSAAEIKDWVNARLGKTQRVSDVVIREDLPRSTIGKVLKRELRDEYIKQKAS